MASAYTIRLRLSADAVQLQALLSPACTLVPRAVLAAQLRAEAAQLSIDLPLTAHDLDALLRDYRYGTWMTVLVGTPPSPPADGRVELLVPVPVAAYAQPDTLAGAGGRPHLLAPRQAVRAGTALARVRSGRPGTAGRDLLGREIALRPPRPARLPSGENTYVAGATLVAACDGEVRLRRLAIDVLPMQVHDGDAGTGQIPLTAAGELFITGSVRGAHVIARGNLHVQGDAHESCLESLEGSISVAGEARGGEQHRNVLRASVDIACAGIDHSDLQAGGHIRLYGTARGGTLRAGGNLYVQSVEQSLLDVQVHLGGGLVVAEPAPEPFLPVRADRQHVRVAVSCAGSLCPHGGGMYDGTPLRFEPCTIVDLSTGGARCRMSTPRPQSQPRPGTLVQLKVDLPDGHEQVVAIARVSRAAGTAELGLSFLWMTRQDQERLRMFCMRLLVERGPSTLPTRADRVTSDE